VNEVRTNLQKLIVEIENTKSSFQVLASKIEETKNFVTKSDIENLAKKFVNIEDFSSLNVVNRSEMQSVLKETETMKEEIKNVKKELIPSNIIQQIANKLSLLEAKISDLEKRLEMKVRPIILE
jgi:hypothetical protein